MDERGGHNKAREAVPLKRKRRIFNLGILLVLLVISKIVISGAYLGLCPVQFEPASMAMAQSAEPATPDQNAASRTPDVNVNRPDKKAGDLKARELELEKREEELLPLKTEIEEKLVELNELQLKLTAYAKRLADREKALEDSKMGHLVELYSAMEPERAAAIMDRLKDPTVVLILRHMKGKSAGKILAVMNPERGAAISEKLTNLD